MAEYAVMEQTYTPTPPDGYHYHNHLFADMEHKRSMPFWLLLVWANFVALIPLTGGILLLWLPYQIYRLQGHPLALLPALSLPLPGKILLGIIILISSMLLHEWLHGMALKITGHRPRYSFSAKMLLATIEKGDFLTRTHYLFMTLTPVTVMSLGGWFLLIVLPPVISQLVLIALLLNTAASTGDLMVAIRVYRLPKTAVFTDDQGICVFLPAVATLPNPKHS
jgi:hypothetical protein